MNIYFVQIFKKITCFQEEKLLSCWAVEDYGDRNPSSIFLRAVEEKEIVKIVSKYKNNKISTEWNETDTTLVMAVIDGIANPLTYICNLSFKMCTLLCKMKNAKVIPLY